MGGLNFPPSLAVGQNHVTNFSQWIEGRSDSCHSQAGTFIAGMRSSRVPSSHVEVTMEAHAGMEE